jgi:RHS repeat-associated protein
LTAVSDPAGHTTTFAYNALGERTQKNLPNGVVVEYLYDDLGRLTRLVQRKDGLPLASYTYTLDAAGNRLSVSEADGSSIHWTYDDAYRLTSETRRDAGGAITYRAAFTYDPAGNRLSQETTVNGLSSTVHYTYNALDQLVTAGTAQYEYDGRGNLTRVTAGTEVTTYTWDAADRLVTVHAPSSTVQYAYDADGRRVQQITDTQVINYLWDEASLYGDVILETDASGNTLAAYVLGGTELLSQNRGGTIRYYLQDAQGSTRTLTDASGNVTDTYAYTAFGETLSHSGASVNPYRYTDQQFDALTGLYSLRARYYDPALGRFLSRDPAEPLLTAPHELNRYVYVADNPLNAADPSGRFAAVEYSMANNESEEESAALTPVGEETASELQALTEEFESTQTWDTTRNARILRANIRDGDVLGRLGNPGDHAHHIVPSTDRLAQSARDILDAVRIDINSKSNGLWLRATMHYDTYSPAYVEMVNRLIQDAYAAGGREAVIDALKNIAQAILAGVFP